MASRGQLTTHVLDTSNGRPAGGMVVELLLGLDGGRSLTRTRTNSDGRTDEPLLARGELEVGRYQLVFGVGAYYGSRGVALPDPPFLDEVVLRFGVADADAHYHVPLLVSPWAYSTYRGS